MLVFVRNNVTGPAIMTSGSVLIIMFNTDRAGANLFRASEIAVFGVFMGVCQKSDILNGHAILIAYKISSMDCTATRR